MVGVLVLFSFGFVVSASEAQGQAAEPGLPALPNAQVSPGSVPLPTQPVPTQSGLLTPSANIRPDASLLKSGDQVEVTVLGFPELSGEQRLTANGAIQIPLAGNIFLGGLTPTQATERVSAALLPYVRRPQVSVTLLSISPPRISVTGAVRRPGPHLVVPPNLPEGDFSDLTDGDFQTLSYALILAGGVTPDANLRNITIRRPMYPGAPSSAATAASVPTTELTVDLWRVIQQGELAADLRIYDGDEIVVSSGPLSDAEQQALLSSTVAPISISVQVAGEVRNPGSVEVLPTADLTTALAAAGGPTNEAKSSIALFRIGPEGQLTQQTYEFGDASQSLRDGDVIVVEQRRSVGILNFLSLLLSPLGDLADTIRLFD